MYSNGIELTYDSFEKSAITLISDEPVIENEILSYLITNISCQEQTVTITGDEELLNTISEIDIQIPISMELEDITQLQFIKTTPLLLSLLISVAKLSLLALPLYCYCSSNLVISIYACVLEVLQMQVHNFLQKRKKL